MRSMVIGVVAGLAMCAAVLLLGYGLAAVADALVASGAKEQKRRTCAIAGGVLVDGWCVNRMALIVLDQSQQP